MAARRRLGAALSGGASGAMAGLGILEKQKLLELLGTLGQDETPSWGPSVPFGPGPPGGQPVVNQNLLRILRELDLFGG